MNAYEFRNLCHIETEDDSGRDIGLALCSDRTSSEGMGVDAGLVAWVISGV